jgi:NADPH:quinone reductase-like Zn-dependent oxidoreductase
MKAILLTEAGGTENFIYADIEKPILKPGEVLVKVKAIGINPADAYARQNEEMITMFAGAERPAIIGWDISGEITEKEGDTGDFEIGDNVFGFTLMGKAYAEYVPIAASAIAKKPANITHEEAAAFPLAGLTGGQPILHVANIKKGDIVLIHGGSGGVGHYAVQIAKYLGAKVIATSSAKNRDFILSLGADQHIDYTSQNFWEVIKDVDFVLDTIGGDTLEHSIDIIKPGGKVVTVIPPSFSQELAKKAGEKGVQLTLCMVSNNGNDMQYFAGLFAKGALKSHISAVFHFDEMSKAHTLVETGRTVGKIVVTL